MRPASTRLCVLLPLVLAAGCGSSESDPGGATPTGSTSHPAKVYVANEDGGSVSVLDGHDYRVLKTISVDPADGSTMFMPHNVQVAPDGKTVWVTTPPMEGHASTTEEVVVVDTATDAIAARIPLGDELHLAHVVLDPTSSRVFVSAYAKSAIFEIDALKRTVTKRIDLAPGTGPHGMRHCGGKLFAAAMDGKAILIVDTDTSAVTSVPVGGIAVQIGCSPDARYAFASLYDTKEVVRYELASGAVTRVALPPESQGPVQVYPSPDGKTLYVADQGLLLDRPASDQLYFVDVASWAVRASVKVGRAAHGVVASEDGTRVFVTNVNDATVSVVDPIARAVVGTVTVGAKPNGISHWHGDGGMP